MRGGVQDGDPRVLGAPKGVIKELGKSAFGQKSDIERKRRGGDALLRKRRQQQNTVASLLRPMLGEAHSCNAVQEVSRSVKLDGSRKEVAQLVAPNVLNARGFPRSSGSRIIMMLSAWERQSRISRERDDFVAEGK